MTSNIFDPCIYSTLIRSILVMQKNLDQISEFYARIFDFASNIMGIPSLARELDNITKKMYDEALKWNVQEEFLRKIYSEIKEPIIDIVSKRI